MVNLLQILHTKPVKNHIQIKLLQLLVSYTRTIAGKVFYFKQSIKNLDFKIGTSNLSCECHVSDLRYEPVGHVVTGNLGTSCKATFLCVRNLCEFVKTGLLINLCTFYVF